MALIQLADNGRAHLIPVTIMINGNFYDASVYKADPVPMALQPGTVYEGVKAGVSQGLFTARWSGPGKRQLVRRRKMGDRRADHSRERKI